MREFQIPDADAMEEFGAGFAPMLKPGDLIQLDGELGAGKTTFTRGLGAALGAREPITSPTFVLARVHPTASGTPLVHVDAYRLATAVEVEDLDLDWENSIVVVEWGAGKLDDAGDRIEIAIARPVGGDPLAEDSPRQVRVSGVGARWAMLDTLLDRASAP